MISSLKYGSNHDGRKANLETTFNWYPASKELLLSDISVIKNLLQCEEGIIFLI